MRGSSFIKKMLFVLYFRGPVVRVDSAGPSTGGILLSPDKRRLVWDIGKFVGMCCPLVTLRAIGFSYADATLKAALSFAA